jgi:hypothetical protein
LPDRPTETRGIVWWRSPRGDDLLYLISPLCWSIQLRHQLDLTDLVNLFDVVFKFTSKPHVSIETSQHDHLCYRPLTDRDVTVRHHRAPTPSPSAGSRRLIYEPGRSLSLYIPSILVNPKSKEQATRDSYLLQQREHALAQARKRQDDKVGKVGKRRERRRENGELEARFDIGCQILL